MGLVAIGCMNGSMGGFLARNFLELFDLLVELECMLERVFFFSKKKGKSVGFLSPRALLIQAERDVFFFSSTAYIVRLRLRVA